MRCLRQASLPASLLIITTLLVLKESDASAASRFPRRHTRSPLSRSSSSSDTVRLPMYQNIQRNRLRKISRGPDSTKKSQELRGAKIPTKKRTSPLTSRITAIVMHRVVHFFCSIIEPAEKDEWI